MIKHVVSIIATAGLVVVAPLLAVPGTASAAGDCVNRGGSHIDRHGGKAEDDRFHISHGERVTCDKNHVPKEDREKDEEEPHEHEAHLGEHHEDHPKEEKPHDPLHEGELHPHEGHDLEHAEHDGKRLLEDLEHHLPHLPHPHLRHHHKL